MKRILPLLLLPSWMIAAAPTEDRAWRSAAGTTVQASAREIKDGVVHLQTKEGRPMMVPLDKFAEEDRAFLADHFDFKPADPGATATAGNETIRDGLAFPVGKTAGPVDAGEGSHYFVYLPDSLRAGRKAPMMLYTGAGGGRAQSVSAYQEAADLNGWIIAASVESKNSGDHPVGNHAHAKRCVEHLLKTLPIDDNRVYFSGNSGGGAMSFYNALRIKSAGNMPYIGYSPDGKFDKKQYCYGIGGTSDYNRYLTARAASQFGNRGFHRLVVGKHSVGPQWVGNEGITWLNGRFLGDRKSDRSLDSERLDFEAGMIGWIKGLMEDTPHRAHYWCDFMEKEYKIGGANAAAIGTLRTELEKNPLNARYTAGIAAIDEFSEKYYVEFGESGGSSHKHTTDKIRSASEKLAKEYSGVPEIEAIARALGEPTI